MHVFVDYVLTVECRMLPPKKKLQTELNRTKQSKTRELMIKTHELNAKQRCEYAESNGKK